MTLNTHQFPTNFTANELAGLLCDAKNGWLSEILMT